MKRLSILLLIATYSYGMETVEDKYEIARIDENRKITIANQGLHAKNFSSRNDEKPCILVLHYTAGNLSSSARILTESEAGVSAHYLVPEYEDNQQQPLPIYQLVKEEDTAHHAGISQWRGEWRKSRFGSGKTINDISLGIEIVNHGYERMVKDGIEKPILNSAGNLQFRSFSKEQMKRVIYISRKLVSEHKLAPYNITGHSDVATWPADKESRELRKVDPGVAFDWKSLAEKGIGMWPGLQSGRDNIERPKGIDIVWIKKALKRVGYYITDSTDNLDETTLMSLNAFRLHYQPEAYVHMYSEPLQLQPKETKQTQLILYDLITQYDIPEVKEQY